MGGETDIIITTTYIGEGVLDESCVPTLALIVGDFIGKEIDPIVEEEPKKLLDDEIFVKSRAFTQFLWRRNINNFEEKYKMIKIEVHDRKNFEIEE